jgi:hypothetical protein
LVVVVVVKGFMAASMAGGIKAGSTSQKPGTGRSRASTVSEHMRTTLKKCSVGAAPSRALLCRKASVAQNASLRRLDGSSAPAFLATSRKAS